jgi:hypothetical protein
MIFGEKLFPVCCLRNCRFTWRAHGCRNDTNLQRNIISRILSGVWQMGCEQIEAEKDPYMINIPLPISVKKKYIYPCDRPWSPIGL